MGPYPLLHFEVTFGAGFRIWVWQRKILLSQREPLVPLQIVEVLQLQPVEVGLCDDIINRDFVFVCVRCNLITACQLSVHEGIGRKTGK